ncbi:MAG: SDR family oxidoreductase [Pseudomonadota bacterium]|nr:SDR family oxidoreductase [Pseudomonadota bacterium]
MSGPPDAQANRDFARTRVLVTGAAGFLGSHLCDALIAQGHDVVGLDNYYTGRKGNLTHLLAHPQFEIVRHDVRQPYWGEFDLIYDLACPASPPFYQRNAIATAKISFLGALNALGLAKRTGARIFFASTSEVYGDPLEHPQTEGYRGSVNPIGPRACYDEGKRIAEALFFDYHRQHDIDIKVARIFNTYGPRMNPYDGRVVSNFIVQALKGDDITIYGEGGQTRSFCFVDDLIRGFLLVMAAPRDFTGPVNLGNPDEFTIRELAEQVIDATGSRSKLVFRPLPVDDPRQRCPDISLARERFGWEPGVKLKEGLARTAAFFEQELSLANAS